MCTGGYASEAAAFMLALGRVSQQAEWQQQLWITQHGDAFDSAALEVMCLSMPNKNADQKDKHMQSSYNSLDGNLRGRC